MSPCVPYEGLRNEGGYGYRVIQRNYQRKKVFAHRQAWEDVNGPIPDGLFVCHHCDNPPCINVEHLFLGTNDDNMADMVAKNRAWWQKQTHCVHGHEFTPENTMVRPGGGRDCRTCKRARWREWNAKREVPYLSRARAEKRAIRRSNPGVKEEA